ncbi:tyrosine-protein phosphatase, partial [Enterococcus lactis]
FDVDLRSDTERTKAPDKKSSKIKLIANPVFNSGHDKTEQQYAEQYMDDANRGKQNMINSYQSMVTSPSAQKAFKNLFKTLLANTGDGAVLFHCAQGK